MIPDEIKNDEENPDEPGRTVYLPAAMWDRLTEIALELKAMAPRKKGYSRNKLIKHALKEYVERWDLMHADKKRK